MNKDCSWVFFSSQSQDCMSCVHYSECQKEIEKRDPDKMLNNYLITTAVVEDDAKEYADFLREQDKIESGEYYPEETPQGESEEPIEKDYVKKLKSYKELEPIAAFFDAENIPYIYIPPNELYASTFMMVTFAGPDLFTVRLNAMVGVAKDIKLTTKAFKARNNRVYKYSKRGTIDIIFPIIRNVIAYRKSHAS